MTDHDGNRENVNVMNLDNARIIIEQESGVSRRHRGVSILISLFFSTEIDTSHPKGINQEIETECGIKSYKGNLYENSD